MLGSPDAVEINYQGTLGTFETERKLRGETVVPFLVTRPTAYSLRFLSLSPLPENSIPRSPSFVDPDSLVAYMYYN